MFTGIIEGMGKIQSIHRKGQGLRLSIQSDFSLKTTKIGDSIAVNGVCLTATSLSDKQFDVDVSPETCSISTFKTIRPNDPVNLERAMRLSDRIDGHLVSGHVDGIGKIVDRQTKDNAIFISFQVPDHILRYLIQKGSVAIDGISLTVNQITTNAFEVCIIPHTATLTTIRMKSIGDDVNIETDLVGKYIEQFITHPTQEKIKEKPKQQVDMAFLYKTGFIS